MLSRRGLTVAAKGQVPLLLCLESCLSLFSITTRGPVGPVLTVSEQNLISLGWQYRAVLHPVFDRGS